MMSFARTPALLNLDVVGQRYGIRPSEILGIPPYDPESILIDQAIVEAAAEKESLEQNTDGGKMKAKRMSWDKEMLKEIRDQQRDRRVEKQ